MRATTHTATDPGFITLCIQIAQATFSDVMPSRTEFQAAPAKANAGANRSVDHSVDQSGFKPGWISRLNDWFYRQQVNAREAYLAQSTDIFDLEHRIRYLERRPNL